MYLVMFVYVIVQFDDRETLYQDEIGETQTVK